MELPIVKNTSELLNQISKKELYVNLVIQLNKDFTLIGLEIDFDEFKNPLTLFNYLIEVISELMQNNFNDFLNLLYRIDIPEQKITEIINSGAININEQISFLILRREWQKVWFKAFY